MYSPRRLNVLFLGSIHRFLYILGMSFGGGSLVQRTAAIHKDAFRSLESMCSSCQHVRPSQRFSTSPRARQQQHQYRGPFTTRLRVSLRETKVQWKYRIPVGLGIGFLGAVQFFRVQEPKKKRQHEEQDSWESTSDSKGKTEKRNRIRPSGPW